VNIALDLSVMGTVKLGKVLIWPSFSRLIVGNRNFSLFFLSVSYARMVVSRQSRDSSYSIMKRQDLTLAMERSPWQGCDALREHMDILTNQNHSPSCLRISKPLLK